MRSSPTCAARLALRVRGAMWRPGRTPGGAVRGPPDLPRGLVGARAGRLALHRAARWAVRKVVERRAARVRHVLRRAGLALMTVGPAPVVLGRGAPVAVAPPLVVHALRPVAHGLAARDEGQAQCATAMTDAGRV